MTLKLVSVQSPALEINTRQVGLVAFVKGSLYMFPFSLQGLLWIFTAVVQVHRQNHQVIPEPAPHIPQPNP